MRRVLIAMAACTSVLLIACSSAALSGSPTATPTSTVEPSPSSSPSIAPTASPPQATASGDVLAGFALNDILRVEVNGLAVRVQPYTDMLLTTGWTWNGSGYESIGDVRLNAGDFVSVELGPVMIGDTTWYRVSPAEGGLLHHGTVIWNSKNPMDGGTYPAWVAASVGPDIYLTLHEAYEYDRSVVGLPPSLLVSGTGDYVSEPLENHDLIGLEWIFLIDDQSAPCDFTVTLEPAAGGTGVVVVDESLMGALEEGAVGLGTGDRKPVVGEGFEPFLVRVASGCEWSILLEWMAHD